MVVRFFADLGTPSMISSSRLAFRASISAASLAARYRGLNRARSL